MSVSRAGRTRYYQLPASFFADAATRDLSPLAVCLLCRARAESLIGVLERSPRVLALAHRGVTPRDVETALGELEARGLVAWWPDLDLVVVVGGALDAKGSAAKAAQALIGQLPEAARMVPVTPPPMHPVRGEEAPPGAPLLPGLLPGPVAPQEQDQQQEQDQDHTPGARATPGPKPKRTPKPKPEIRPEAAPVIERLQALRAEIGLPALRPSEVSDRWICARIADGIPVADLVLALELRADEIRRDGVECRSASYFDCSSPFTGPGPTGAGGWSMSRGMLDRFRAREAARAKREGGEQWVPPGGTSLAALTGRG